MNQDPKLCDYCGRRFEWRKKWEKNWSEVKFCSSKCSKQNMKTSEDIEDKIMELLNLRGRSKSICPSEVLAAENKSNKVLMEEVRCAARRLVHQGKILITQKNKPVDPSDFRGPIRLKLK